MSRFYNLAGDPQITVPKKDGSGLRSVTITDAKKNGWIASVSTICGIVRESDFLTAWKISQHLDAAVGTSKLLARNHNEWKKEVRKKAEEEMSKAPKLGSEVHNAVESYFRLKLAGASLDSLRSTEPPLLPYLTAIHQFTQSHSLVPQQIETRVVVPSARSAGTCDFVGEMDGVPTILDWKTQNIKGADPNYYFQFPLQLAAYWHGLGDKGRIVSVIIDTSGHDRYDVDKGLLPAIHFKEYSSPLSYYQLFESLSRIYYVMNDWEK